MVRCIEIAGQSAELGRSVMIFNQMTETCVLDLANLVAELTGATVEMVPDPERSP